MLHDLLVLPEIPESLVEVLHARYIDVEPEESNRIQELVEIIADVRQPMVVIETAQNKEEKRLWELKVDFYKLMHPMIIINQNGG